VPELDVLKLDVFAEDVFSGNPAWVVLGGDSLDDVLMQRVASELGSPETAFALKSKRADVRLRYFHEQSEEPISGHCTIGALWTLAEQGQFGSVAGSRHRAETPIGILPFWLEPRQEGGTAVWMTQHRPMFSKVDEVTEVASALGIGAELMFHKEFQMCRATTGLPCLLVPIRALEHMEKIAPRPDEVVALCHELGVAAISAYSWSGFDPSSTVHVRCFLPSPSFREDPASGMPAGALGAYLVENGFIPREDAHRIVVEQGHFVGRPSKISVQVEKRGSSIRKVDVGGSVRLSLRGRISVP